jgi:hypothetical protein
VYLSADDASFSALWKEKFAFEDLYLFEESEDSEVLA